MFSGGYELDTCELQKKAKYLRAKALQTAWYGKAGHITSSLSEMDILTVLYFGGALKYRPDDELWDGRDRFILSKAHGGLGYYTVLAEAGFFPKEKLRDYCHPGQHLGDHSNYMAPGVETTGGSLGHGLGIAAGKALAIRMRRKSNFVYVLTGDGECQEGSVWEAAMTIANKRLTNVVWIIDYNGLQANGRVEEVNSLEPLTEKLSSFGWIPVTVDGHNYEALQRELKIAQDSLFDKPKAVIARTIKGKGLPLLENKEGWHGRTPTKDEYDIIIGQLGYTLEEFQAL